MVQWRMSRCCPRSPPSDPPGASAMSSTTFSKGARICSWWWYGPPAKTWSTYLSMPKLPWMRMAARRRCTLRTWMTTGARTFEQMPPKGPLGKTHHGKDLCSTTSYMSMEKDPSLSNPVYSLRSDSPHQWSVHGPRTVSAGLCVTHNNDPITFSSPPPPLLIGVSDDRVKGADCTTPLEARGEDSDRRWSYFLAQESIDIIDELRQEVRAAHNMFHLETVAAKPPHQDMYVEDVPGLSAEEVTTLSQGYTAPLPQVRGFAMKQLDRVRTSFAGAQKPLHLLFVKLVGLPNESPGPVHRAVQRRLVPDDRSFLTSYTVVVESHAAHSTTNGYLVPFSSGGLPQPWNTLPFPTVAGESLICPSDCIGHLLGKRSGMYEPLVLIVLGFGIHRVTHRAGYLVLPPLDCTMAPLPDNLGQVGPCTGCNKKQSTSKRSPCTLCQEELVCRSCSQAGICCRSCRTNPGWHLEFKAKTVIDTPSLSGTASFFMLCDENTHLYLTVVDMPRAVTEVRRTGDTAPSLEHRPLRQVCHGNSIISTGFDTVLATVHAPRGVGIILRNVQFGGFIAGSPPYPQFPATRGRVLWCTLFLPQTPLLDYCMARYYG